MISGSFIDPEEQHKPDVSYEKPIRSYGCNEYEQIIGQTLKSVYINQDKTDIIVECENGKFYPFVTDGDCCSETWIEHVTLPWREEKIEKVEEIDLGDAMPTRQEHDCLYGISIGSLHVEFRNSSNGYYGGYIEMAEPIDKLPEGFAKLEEDL